MSHKKVHLGQMQPVECNEANKTPIKLISATQFLNILYCVSIIRLKRSYALYYKIQCTFL